MCFFFSRKDRSYSGHLVISDMEDDDDDDNTKLGDLRNKVLKKIKNKGFTEYEIQERTEAAMFLFFSFYKLNKHWFLMKQIPYLMKPDTMSNIDWIDYLEISWEASGLIFGNSKIREKCN